jgi:SAM-dependent methyltransferase
MMSGGNGRRPNARCPYCDALERHRLLWLFIKEKTDILNKRCDVLHFAPEYCFIRALKNYKNIRYTSADLSSPLAAVHTDITDLIFPDASFEYIICSHVLEHIPDDAKALSELYRVAQPGGNVLLMTPIEYTREETLEDTPGSAPEQRRELFGAEDHVRIYGRDFAARIAKSGFSVQEIDFFATLSPALQNKYALLDEEHIFVATKTEK